MSGPKLILIHLSVEMTGATIVAQTGTHLLAAPYQIGAASCKQSIQNEISVPLGPVLVALHSRPKSHKAA